MPLPDTVEDWLNLHQQSHPWVMDFTLERLREVLQRLGCASPDCPVYTVGGTNGKGSVTAFAAAILQADGRRVGVFTSPHLLHYAERIQIDGRPVADDELRAAFRAVWEACGAITLTYFEHSLAAAVWLFRRARLDAWVLEVGLGGRLDAVNVFDAAAAAVVSVALDHEAVLGHTVELIAAEKAGIFRRGRPAVCGAGITPVLCEQARQVGALLRVAGEDFSGQAVNGAWTYTEHATQGVTVWSGLPLPGLEGPHQIGNAAVALALLRWGPPALSPSREAVECGLRTARVAGRFERFRLAGREWVVDVAHNPAAATVLAAALATLPPAPTRWLLGVLADKNLTGVLDGLVATGASLTGWAVTLSGERGRLGSELAAQATAHGHAGLEPGADLTVACERLQATSLPGERIVACGSFALVAPVLIWLRQQAAQPA